MDRQKLSIDLDSLFPGSSVTIGNQSIIIRPLSIEQLSVISKKITGLGKILVEKNITWKNFQSPENIAQLAVIALENAPFVLEEAANVAIEDLKKLPLELIVQIIDKVIEENLKSKDDLEKNFKSLIKKLTPKAEMKTPIIKKK